MQANSWLDDLKDWSDSEHCCKYFKSNDSFCPHSYNTSICDSCYYSILSENFTREQYNRRYLPHFLNDNPDMYCAKAGHASYASVSIGVPRGSVLGPLSSLRSINDQFVWVDE